MFQLDRRALLFARDELRVLRSIQPVSFMISKTKPRHARRTGRPTTRGSVGREALIAAAREALRRKPPGEITLNEISQIAGVDPALIRYYFGQLSSLFTEAATEITRELRGRLASQIAEKGTVQNSLHRRIQAYMAVFKENPYYNRLMIEAVHLSDSPSRQTVLRLVSHSLDEMRDLAADGSRTGEIKTLDPRFLQLAIVAMCEFFFSAHPVFEAIFGEEAKDPKFDETYADFILSLISISESSAAKSKGSRASRKP